jgi:hypothetical protein
LTGIEHNVLWPSDEWEEEEMTIEAEWSTLKVVMHELSLSEDPADKVIMIKMEMQLPAEPHYAWTEYAVDLTKAEADRVIRIIAKVNAAEQAESAADDKWGENLATTERRADRVLTERAPWDSGCYTETERPVGRHLRLLEQPPDSSSHSTASGGMIEWRRLRLIPEPAPSIISEILELTAAYIATSIRERSRGGGQCWPAS